MILQGFCYLLVCGNFPFKANEIKDLELKILMGDYIIPDKASVEFKDLVNKMLQPNPKLRISIPEILKHPWIKFTNSNDSIFTEEEIQNIKSEYKLNMVQDSLECSISDSIFTEHEIDSSSQDIENSLLCDTNKVLDPFNSMESNQELLSTNIKEEIVSNKTIKFRSKLREHNRKYERDNNSNIDNGVYVKDTMKLKKMKLTKLKISHDNYNENKLSKKVLSKMAELGFETSYVIHTLKNNELNSLSTLYYLLLKKS